MVIIDQKDRGIVEKILYDHSLEDMATLQEESHEVVVTCKSDAVENMVTDELNYNNVQWR